MLSGNGRHRRPRQAPALVVAAGVTGSAIAIPLLGATSASAADSAVWDRVAECESAGQWSANTGNGYYGGLQFSQETWDAFGGAQFADRPDLASRSQQIAVAEKVLAAQGVKAWPSCGSNAGLGAGASTGVDPGADPVPSGPAAKRAADAAKETAPAEPRDAGGRDTGAATPGTDAGQKKETPGKSAEAPGTGKHRGTPATEPGTAGGGAPKAGAGGADAGTDAGAGARTDAAAPDAAVDAIDPSRMSGPDRTSRGDTPGRADARNQGDPGSAGGSGATDPANGTTAQDSKDTAGETTPASGTYTVRTGDNLWAIAEAKDVPGGWPALYEANQKVVGTDPDLILPGQSLDLQPK